MKSILINTLLATLVSFSFAQSAIASDIFSKKVLQELKQQHNNKRWLLLMWSLECPPCFKELAAVAKIKQETPNIPIILVNTDDDNELTQEREQVLVDMGLRQVPSYYFSDQQAGSLRYAIDPKWYGELPRSFFYTQTGQQKGHSGLLNKQQIKNWLLAY